MRGTSLSSALRVSQEQRQLEACLRRVLDKMALALHEAHAGPRHEAGMRLLMAQEYARVAGAASDNGQVGKPSIGAWFMHGPYAGLSVISGLVSEMDLAALWQNIGALVKLSGHARSLPAGRSPFVGGAKHAGFHTCYLDLVKADDERNRM